MTRSVFNLSWFMVLGIVAAAPSKHSGQVMPSNSDKMSTPVVPKYPVEDIQLMQPHYITLEDFESLLRRAGELFRPNAYLVDEATSTPSQKNTKSKSIANPTDVSVPYRQIHPPAPQPFNFYMPVFDYDYGKLDMKSKHLEHFAPPPLPGKANDQINYYTAKSKKLPKKFNAGTKQVNMKWLNAFEKEALTDASGQLPKAVYLLNDERNRINFDDSFFGVDMQVKIPNNQPHIEEHASSANARDEFLNQGEEGGEEDLVAAATGQLVRTVSRV